MNYFSPEEIREAKQVDLLSYLRECEPQELVHISGNTWCTREHDSLKISNGKWHWFSRGIGGRSALDYLIKVKSYSFMEAVSAILGRTAAMPSVSASRNQYDKPKNLLLPKLCEGNPARVMRYLMDRGIDREILEYCTSRKLLYESEKYHNAVFIGYDLDGTARYAAMRATTGTYKGEATGSSKRYSFSIGARGDSFCVHVFESAIDLLSYATLEKRAGRDWRRDALLSLAGVFKQNREKVVPVALKQYLEDHPSVRRIVLHLDNDDVGRGAARGIMDGLADSSYEILDQPPKYGKDVNDQLLRQLWKTRKENARE